jgi:hypothetical protein
MMERICTTVSIVVLMGDPVKFVQVVKNCSTADAIELVLPKLYWHSF